MRRLIRRQSSTQQIGQLVEDKALLYLKKHGLKPICRNYRCRAGEIDLIMNDRQALVFIEVRFRQQTKYGSGADTVDYRKQQKLILTAQHFLLSQHYSEWPACRFDVLAATRSSQDKTSLQFDWIKNAFDLQ
ncbi:MAG: YraN family protein [Pseudomonadales bacterium]|nr:YraN family protein [Pseudomonadales bacterium]